MRTRIIDRYIGTKMTFLAIDMRKGDREGKQDCFKPKVIMQS